MSQTVSQHQTQIASPVLWTVVFLNDDFTPMEFVVQVLVEVFHKSLAEANGIMMTIHNESAVPVGRYTKEVACNKADHVMVLARVFQHPLQVYAEPLQTG